MALIESDLIEWILIAVGFRSLMQQSFMQSKSHTAVVRMKKFVK